ncbi:MAG: hypothetical protein WBA74_09385 [Cyclobacteriaceae bacterium]
MNKTINLLTVLVMMAFAVACTDQSELVKPKTPDEAMTNLPAEDIYLTDEGVLSFSSMELFTSTIHQIKDQQTAEILAWNNSLGFKSLLSRYQAAVDMEEAIFSKYAGLIEQITSLESQEQADAFENTHSEDIKSLEKAVKSMQQQYADVAIFSNNRIIGMKTYDPILAGLLNTDGIVIVQGSTLQYTESQLKVLANQEDPEAIIAVAAASNSEDVFVKGLFASETSSDINTEQEQVYTNRCSTQFYSDRKMTGNSTVRNTVVPVYTQVYVPRTCTTICDGDGELIPIDPGSPTPIDIECREVCSGGYYRNVLQGYNVTNTRLEATLRNYKISCFIGCWENWDKRQSYLTISGVHSESVSLGFVEKKGWTKDLSPRNSGTFTVAYESDYIFPYNGYCATTISW